MGCANLKFIELFVIIIIYLFSIAKSLLDVFKYYTFNKTITSLNGNNFSWLHGFGMMVDFNTFYYVSDFNANIYWILVMSMLST